MKGKDFLHLTIGVSSTILLSANPAFAQSTEEIDNVLRTTNFVLLLIMGISAAIIAFNSNLLVGSLIKRTRTQQLELLAQPYVKKVSLLDTEYIAIVSASPKEASFLAQHIDLYRTTIRLDLKDILLYRIGAYMQIFLAEDKRIEDIIIEQHNWRLNQKQRQKVIQFLAERFGVIL